MNCAWCNRPGPTLREITVLVPNSLGFKPRQTKIRVHPEHEEPTREFVAKLLTQSKYFVLGIGLLAVWALIGLPLWENLWDSDVRAFRRRILYGATAVAVGVMLWVWPFATSVTVQGLGIRTSIIMVRVPAALIVGFGLWMCWSAF